MRPICEAVGVRSDSTGRGNAFSREISQIAPRIGLSAGVRERPIGLYRSVRPICEAVGVRSDSTERGNAFSREISQIAPRIGLSDWLRQIT